MNKSDFARIYATMVAVYPNEKTSEATVGAYFDLLGHHSASDFAVAVKEAMLEPGRAFMPKPGEIDAAIWERRLKLPDVEATVCEILAAAKHGERKGLSVLARATIESAHEEWNSWRWANGEAHVSTRAAIRDLVRDTRSRSIQAASLTAIGLNPPLAITALRLVTEEEVNRPVLPEPPPPVVEERVPEPPADPETQKRFMAAIMEKLGRKWNPAS